MNQHKATVQKNLKRKAEQRQKEAQKREVESLNRKHLAGLRVVQKNLVYVVGLSPGIREEDLLQTLRGDKYFGQYGKIIKIVVSKTKNGEPTNSQSLGVYVTFARKEDAARCIAAVNGSQNGDRVLRAQLGTTKYCSAYLRNETCTNKQCMFLHEPGDNDDSYSRQDLSSINSVSTQGPLQAGSSSASSSRAIPQPQPPVAQSQPAVAAAQPMAREQSRDGTDSADGSALPSSASWANRGVQQRSRRGSHATSVAASPAISAALPAQAEEVEESAPTTETPEATETPEPEPVQAAEEVSSEKSLPQETIAPTANPLFMDIFKSINSPYFRFNPSAEELLAVADFLPLIDDNGGAKRRAIREQDEARLSAERESQSDNRSVPEALEAPEEEEPESGSLQLGGEPEDREDGRDPVNQPLQSIHDQRRPASQLPIQRGNENISPYGNAPGQAYAPSLGNMSSLNGRTLTPLQQQQLLLLKSSQPQANFLDQFPPGIGGGVGHVSSTQSNPFPPQGHNRQASRYNFTNDVASTSSSVKATTNAKLMAQQSSMMPQQGSQFYGTSMPAPPPGLKSTSSTPVNGGGMFGAGFGASAFGNIPKNDQSEMLREMLRNRGGSAASGSVHDSGKREYMFPSFLHQYPSSSTPAPASGLLASLYGPQPGVFHDFGPKQKKKGKKHRHANTSSSGGGGLVDLVDPSILQARMQHQQQQSGAGVGQGMFGGQAPSGYNTGMMYGGGFARW
jgi:CCR4-NOT transcription complex subunit 4